MSAQRTFEARYTSPCLSCEELIRPGDEAKWVDGQVVHADCDIVLDFGRPAPQPCPNCFTVPSLTGVCGCDR